MKLVHGTRIGIGIVLCLAVYAVAQETPRSAPGEIPQVIKFNRDIRPILSENCFTCHGPDQSHRVTPFRFDVEESAKQELTGGRHAIAPGSPESSLMVQRISEPDVKRRMPPESTGKKLSEKQIALLTEWIKQGARWEKHWSFEPPQRPEVPTVVNTAAVRNPIDNFILARLEQEGLKPAPEADRATLLRRVTLDLTGKGPTLAELDAFLADKSPNAYEKVVDRLLQSPHYGERMAVPWLDASRYADTNGYQQDHDRYMWRWRDWVIEAFNKNMPFNQFAMEQLAGDLLPNPTLDQRIATGFNRNHRTNAEGGIIGAEFAVEYVADRVATTSTVFLGLTMGCARCHDHKYDPLTQREYYQLFAYFNNVPEMGLARRGNSNPYIKAPTREQQAELKKLEDSEAAANARFTKLQPNLTASETAWLKTVAAGGRVDWTPSRGLVASYALNGDLKGDVQPVKEGQSAPVASWKGPAAFAEGRLGQAANFDGKAVIEAGNFGNFDPAGAFSLGAWIYPTSGQGAIISRFQGEVQEGGKGYSLQLKDGKLEFLFAFRVPDHDLWIRTKAPLELNQWHHVMMTKAGLREVRGLKLYVDGVPQDVEVLWDVLNEVPPVKDPVRIGGMGSGTENRFVGRIDEARIYGVELTPEEVGMLAAARSVNEIARIPAGQRGKAEADKVRGAYLESAALPADIRDAYHALVKAREERTQYYDNIQTTMVMEEMPTPRETHLLVRGAYDAPGDRVYPGTPAILPAMPAEYPRDRMGLARWITDPKNPLLARVTVNRYWQMYFGTGIVKTVDDFGSQGDPPSHPELLDWLATEFVRTGWNIKQFQKLIVMSGTYRQSSKAAPELIQRDPENRLLAHGARFRLPGEAIRDKTLAMSGLLVEKLGGPSVKPYQPEGLWSELAQLTGDYVQDHGDNLYRRSLYTFWKRTIPPPSMSNFDAPTRESCVMLRGFTNSPLQALDLMNDVTYVEAARVLGERMMKEGGPTLQSRIAYAFRLATSRNPNSTESQVLADSYRYSMDKFQTKTGSAEKYLSAGEHPRDPKLDVKELAAYTSVASLIINLDETVTKQ